MVLSDEQLIERYLAGETEAINELVRRWERRVFNFALRFCGQREEAQDISQDAFTAVVRRLPELRDRKSFASWLYKIVLNQCRMRHRSAAGRQMIPLGSGESEGTLEVEKRLAASRGVENPESASLKQDLVQNLQQAIEALSEEQRTVILLKEYEGLKFHEIAAILECPLSTVKSRLYLGLQVMREFLEQRGFYS
jgi:RNA polymerase sigma-70 factor, ECF subfamily